MSERSYREHPIGGVLGTAVRCIWFLSQPAAALDGPMPQRIPPDGSVELIFHLAEPFYELADAGRARAQSGAFVVGVWTRPITLLAPGRFDTVGVRIRPGRWPWFCADHAAAFTNTTIDAAAVFGRAVDALCDRLREHATDRERIETLSAFLCARLRPRGADIVPVIDRIVQSAGRVRIETLADDAGLSARHCERLFQHHVGVTPKMLSRILRFQRALRHAHGETAGQWAAVAADCGYTDQSHLIRDFAQFAGETPAQLAAMEPELADYFRRR